MRFAALLPIPVPTPQVCFVGEEASRQLSQPDEDAPQRLARAIAADRSREWGGHSWRSASPPATADGGGGGGNACVAGEGEGSRG